MFSFTLIRIETSWFGVTKRLQLFVGFGIQQVDSATFKLIT
jgi:hypothetical protein